MASPTLSLDLLREEYERAEQRRETAAEAEHTAYVAWQEAFGAHEVASQEATHAYRAFARTRKR